MTDRRKAMSRRSGSERRQYQRIKMETEVSLLRSGSSTGKPPINGSLYDVSSNGIRIRLDLPLSVGESLLVQVHNSGKHLFNSTAKVVWQEQDPAGRYSIGCELCVLLTEKQHKTLSEFIDHTSNLNDCIRN